MRLWLFTALLTKASQLLVTIVKSKDGTTCVYMRLGRFNYTIRFQTKLN